MALTPDEIARRPFTPSVDGYHQGEVRSFLDRIANQLRAIQSAQPEGRAELAELSLAIADHEPRLLKLEQRLSSMVESLDTATQRAHETQTAAAAQLVATQQFAAGAEFGNGGVDAASIEQLLQDQRSLAASADEQRNLVQELLADRKATAEQLSSVAEQLASMARAADEQRAVIEGLTGAVDRLSTAAAAGRTQPVTAESFSIASAWALGDEAASPSQPSGQGEQVLYTDPIDGTPVSAFGPGDVAIGAADRAAGESELLTSDFSEETIYSDNANDQLDGVLDDVMENLNDEGKPAS